MPLDQISNTLKKAKSFCQANRCYLRNRKIIKGRKAGLPTSLNYLPTWQCNSRCVSCHIWKKKPDIEKQLSLEKIGEFFSSKSLRKLEQVNISGGEPLLHTKIVEIAGIIHSKSPKSKINIITNALTPDSLDKIIKILDLGVELNIGISLNGPEKAHDRSRGVKGNYKKVIELVDGLKKLKAENLGIYFSYTAQPNTLEFLAWVRDFAKKNNVGFEITIESISKRYNNNDIDREFIKDNLEKIYETFDGLINETGITQPLQRFDLIAFKETVKKMHSKNPFFDCVWGFDKFCLDPYGNVCPCELCDENARMGNVAEEPFDKIWWSDKAENIRKGIADRKCQPCNLTCGSIPSITSSDFFRIWLLTIKSYLGQW